MTPSLQARAPRGLSRQDLCYSVRLVLSLSRTSMQVPRGDPQGPKLPSLKIERHALLGEACIFVGILDRLTIPRGG